MGSRRSVLGLIVVLLVLGAVGLAAVSRLRRPLRVPIDHQVLVYDVPSGIDEAPPAYLPFSLASFRRDQPSLREVCAAIERAGGDPTVDALVLHVGEVSWGWARVAEFRDALRGFRARGKPVHVSLSGGGEQSFLLAAGAEVVSMPETAILQLDGLTMSAMFLRGTYDKLGITPNFASVGEFKSAVETYTRTGFSPPAREALEALLDDQFRILVDSLASARGLAPDSMRRLIDEGPFTAPAAMRAGLLDTLLDEPGLDALASGAGEGRNLDEVPMSRYVRAPEGALGEPEIALVVASGAIVPGRSHVSPWSGEMCGSETVVSALRDARNRRAVKAIVLRVDSPGGSGQASDDIWQEVRRARTQKPVIVSMSNLAASGGYYIACGADRIVAEPSTITGSIGVFGGKLNLLGLYQKLGLNVETASRGRNAEMLSPFRDFTPEEQARYQAQLDDFYRVFLSRVSEGRGMTPERADSLGRGRVWSGASAQGLGLVDTLGGMRTALAVARERAGIDEGDAVRLELYPRPRRSFLRTFLEGLVEDPDEGSGVAALSPVLAAWLAAAQFPAGATLALLPYTLDIR
jgi:protease-4